MATTLDELAYNIKNLMYSGKSNESSNISIKQIKYWIDYYRNVIIQENIDKGILNDNRLYQNIALKASESPLIQKMTDNWTDYATGNFSAGEQSWFEKFPKTKWSSTHPRAGNYIDTYGNSFIPLGYHVRHEEWLSSKHLDMYGRDTRRKGIGEGRNKAHWSMFGWFNWLVPDIFHDGKQHAVDYFQLSREVSTDIDYEAGGAPTRGTRTVGIDVPITNRNKEKISKYNRFTNTEQPRFYIDTYDSNQAAPRENYSELVIKNLLLAPNPGGPANPGADRWFIYYATLKAVFTNPRKLRFKRSARESTGGSAPVATKQWWTSYFDDDNTPYPLPAKYIKPLVERILAAEANVISAGPVDLLSDDIDTTKLQAGMPQSGQRNVRR